MRAKPALSRVRSIVAAVTMVSAVAGGSATAETIQEFYSGRTVTILVGFGPGGGYDLTARLVSAHLGRHISGHPTVVVQNMPGAASVKAANYLYNATPKSGVYVGSFLNNIVLNKTLGGSARYDPVGFNWLGRVGESATFLAVWYTSPVRTIADAKQHEVVVAATGATGHSAIVPWALNRMLNTKFKVVTGYKSSAAAALAMEQGEATALGTVSWPVLAQGKPEWLAKKRVTLLYVNDISRHPRQPDVPTLGELAQNEDDRKVLRLLASPAALGRSYVAAPGVPVERAAALRNAFSALVKDPVFLADAEKRRIDISPLSGEELTEVVKEAASASPAIVERTKRLTRRPD